MYETKMLVDSEKKTLEGNVIDLDRDLSMAPLKDLWMQNQREILVYQPSFLLQ